MSEYTEGEWEVIKGDHVNYDYIAHLGEYLVVPPKNEEGERELGNIEKDVVLIKTSPELLEAAELALKKYRKQRKYNEQFYNKKFEKGEVETKLEQAILKAKGEIDV